MGRPHTSAPRCRQLNISLTEAEFLALCQRAVALGMRPVHLGRKLVTEGKMTVAASAPTASNLERLIYSQLSRMGNLLNQMMRHLHQTGEPIPADLGPLLTDIRQVLQRVQP